VTHKILAQYFFSLRPRTLAGSAWAHRCFCFSVSASARARGMGKQKLKKQQKKVARKQLAHPKAKSEPTTRREALSVATLHRSLEEASASTAARA
jgi:hypothetical protein